VLIRPTLGLDIIGRGGEVGWCTTVGDDELAEASDLLPRCDERIGEPLVLSCEELDLCLQVLQPLFLALAALESSLKGWVSRQTSGGRGELSYLADCARGNCGAFPPPSQVSSGDPFHWQ
jgi:hypothetical protein